MQGRLVCRDSWHTCIHSLQFLTHFPRSSTTVKKRRERCYSRIPQTLETFFSWRMVVEVLKRKNEGGGGGGGWIRRAIFSQAPLTSLFVASQRIRGRRINVCRDGIVQGNETLRFLVVQSGVSEIAHFLLCLIFISTMWFME